MWRTASETMTSLETLDNRCRLDVEPFVGDGMVVSVYRLDSRALCVVNAAKHDIARSS